MKKKRLLDSYALLAYLNRERGFDKVRGVLANAVNSGALHPLSFADCFAVSTAQRENAIILTGDPEFKSVENLVEIDWLGPKESD